MTDDLHDIDPAVVDAVLANADAFIKADLRVDQIISWGESEMKERERKIKTTGGTMDDFKRAAAEIESVVARKLSALEVEIKNTYHAGNESTIAA